MDVFKYTFQKGTFSYVIFNYFKKSMLTIPSKPPRYTNNDRGVVTIPSQTPSMFAPSQNLQQNNIGLFPANKPLPPPQAGSQMARNAGMINSFSKPLGLLGNNSNAPTSQNSLGFGSNLSSNNNNSLAFGQGNNTSDDKFAGSFIKGAPLFGSPTTNTPNNNGTILGNAQLFKDVPHAVANPILKNLGQPLRNKFNQAYPTFPDIAQDPKKHFPIYQTSKLNPDKQSNVKYIKCIAAIKENFDHFKNKEMLRVQYYTQNNPKLSGNQNQLPSLASLSSNNTQHHVLFSNTNQPVNNPFKNAASPQQSPGLFSKLPPPVNNTATNGIFGVNAQTKSLFVAQPGPAASIFAQNKQNYLFGSTNTPQQAPLFGNQSQANLFGNQGNNSNTGHFGSQPQVNPLVQNTQADTASLFGNVANNGTSLFGNQTSTEGFNLGNQSFVQNGVQFFPPQMQNSYCQQPLYNQISWYSPIAFQQQNQFNEIIFNCLQNIQKNEPTQLTKEQLDHIQLQWELYNQIFQLYDKIMLNLGWQSAKYYFLQFDDDIFDRLINHYHQLLTFGKICQNDVFLIELKNNLEGELKNPTEYSFEYFYQGYINNDGKLFYGDAIFRKKLQENEIMVRQIFARRRKINEYFVPLTQYTRQREETVFPVRYISSNSCFLTDQNDDSAPGSRKPFDYECFNESEQERTKRYYDNLKPSSSSKDREVTIKFIDQRRQKQ